MSRAYPLLLSLLVIAVLGVPFLALSPASGDQAADAKKKADPIPPRASDEEADEALKIFKVAFKARGKKGDMKIAEQDAAMRRLSKVQHPDVVDALVKVTKNRNVDLRTAAVLQLGRLRALPGYAGVAVMKAMDRNRKDPTFIMAGLESIGTLRYLGASGLLIGLLKHPEYAVQKNALVTMGVLKDPRFIEEIIKIMKALRLESGASWDGVSVTHDTGTAGDGDQKAAEAAGKAAEAKNKKKGKRAARSQRDLGPVVLQTAKELTGEEFTGSIAARKWLKENRKQVDEAISEIKKLEKEQLAK